MCIFLYIDQDKWLELEHSAKRKNHKNADIGTFTKYVVINQREFPMLIRLIAAHLLAFMVLGCVHGTKPNTKELDPPELVDLKIISRAQWGWVPLSDSIPTHEIKYITVHHGGEDFPEDKDPVKYLRGLQSWSRADKDWIDIPYHYMIDLKGNIYEARPLEYPGDTNTDYDVRGHALICIMGNYENQIISEKQLDQLARVIGYLAKKYSVPLDELKGHKDYTETLCPGKDIYKYLQDGSLANRVIELGK